MTADRLNVQVMLPPPSTIEVGAQERDTIGFVSVPDDDDPPQPDRASAEADISTNPEKIAGQTDLIVHITPITKVLSRLPTRVDYRTLLRLHRACLLCARFET